MSVRYVRTGKMIFVLCSQQKWKVQSAAAQQMSQDGQKADVFKAGGR
jgi:hypothetical protein